MSTWYLQKHESQIWLSNTFKWEESTHRIMARLESSHQFSFPKPPGCEFIENGDRWDGPNDLRLARG
jgi:hypothetical protein